VRVHIQASHFKLGCVVTFSLVVANCGGSSTPASPSPPPTPTVTSVQVTGLQSLSPGETAQGIARASLSDGSTQVVTSQATWRSENTDVATVSPGGLVTAVRAGTAEIRATYQAASGGASVEVSQAAPPPTQRFSICGDVTEAGVGPIVTAELEVRDGLNARRIGETDAAGQYCLRDLTADTFTLRAWKSGYEYVDQRVTLNVDVTVRFTLAKTAVPLYAVCGTIRESASAALVAGVLVQIRNGTNVGKSTTTDGVGKYCLPNLQAESFTVRASKTLYDTIDRTITLTGNATLDFGLLVTAPTITIGSNGAVSPSQIFIAVGQRVTFVNAHSFGHSMASDPHPSHTSCPELGSVGFLSPGQSRPSDMFNRAVTCGYHDHNDSANPGLNGTIVVR
jgi:plastocyanin